MIMIWRFLRASAIAIVACLVALTLLSRGADAAGPRVALVVGQDDYPDSDTATKGLPRLFNSGFDARRMAALLAKAGFDVISCKGKEPGCFDLTGTEFSQILGELKAKATGADLALVYFAGHGMATEQGNILAPTDANVDCATGAVNRGVLVDEMLQAASPAREKLVILDACRDNPLAKVCPGLAGKKLAFTRIEPADMNNLLIVTSTQFGQSALDGEAGQHSPFANALFAALEANPTIYFEQVMNEVARATAEAAKMQGGFVQIPGKVVGGAAPATCLVGKNCIGDPRMAALAADVERLVVEADRLIGEKFANQSRRLAQLALEQRKEYNYAKAGLISLEAIGELTAQSALPVSGDAIPELDAALRGLRATDIRSAGVPHAFIHPVPARGIFVTYGFSPEPVAWDMSSRNKIISFRGHADRVIKVATNADSSILATGDKLGHVQLWTLPAGVVLTALQPHQTAIRAVAVHPTKPIIATSGDGGPIIVTDTTNKKVLATLNVHTTPVNQLQFTGDGKQLISHSFDSLMIWNTATYSLEPFVNEEFFDVTSYHVDRLYSRIVIENSDGRIKTIDLGTGRKVIDLAPAGTKNGPITLSPDGAIVAIPDLKDGGNIVLKNALTGETLTKLRGVDTAFSKILFNAEGAYLLAIASSSVNPRIFVWEKKTGALVAAFNDSQTLFNDAAFAADGNTIMSLSADRTLRYWHIKRTVPEFFSRATDLSLRDVQVSENGKTLATFGSDGFVRIWDLQTLTEIRSFSSGRSGIKGVGFSKDGSRLMGVEVSINGRTDKSRAIVWNVSNGSRLLEVAIELDVLITSAISPDGRYIAISSRSTRFIEGTLDLWDVDTRQRVAQLSGHLGPIVHVEFSRDSQLLLTHANLSFGAGGMPDTVPRIWRVRTGQPFSKLEGHTHAILVARLSSDGLHAFTTSPNTSTAIVWQSASGAILRKFNNVIAATQPAFSPNGQLFAVLIDQEIHVYDVTTWTRRFSIPVPRRAASSIFSPDSSRIAVYDDSNLLEIWDVRSQRLISKMADVSEKDVGRAVWSPDAMRIFTTRRYEGPTVRAWDVATGRELGRFTTPDNTPLDNGVIVALDGARIVTKPRLATGHSWTWSAPSDAGTTIAKFKAVVPRCLTPRERSDLLLPIEPPAWCITGPGFETERQAAAWKPKWPYDTAGWRDWYVAKLEGRQAKMPSSQ